MNPNQEQIQNMYRTMVSIRHFEETVKREFGKGIIPGFSEMLLPAFIAILLFLPCTKFSKL